VHFDLGGVYRARTIISKYIVRTPLRYSKLEGVIAEPAGAVALAVALKIKGRLQGRRVVVMVTGGNVDPETLASWLASRE
jgi:threonine dehydratase